MSRPAHTPTTETRGRVRALARFGLSEDEIARVFLIGPRTLRKYYRVELGVGRTNKKSQIGRAPFRGGVAKGKRAIMAQTFWLIARAKWTAPALAELAGKTSAPSDTRPLEDLSDEELLAIIRHETDHSGESTPTGGP
jgi:hypothetical protein